jgi:glutaredoxin
MFNIYRHDSGLSAQLLWSFLLISVCALPAQAQYKVVGSDGKITYTDRPATQNNNVQPLDAKGKAANEVALPYELRQAISKFPVVLYTTSKCSPCDLGRQLLSKRGIAFAEKSVSSTEDTALLEKITGQRQLPSLSIGTQMLTGFQASEWHSYLDTAGYPKENRLPANFPPGTATPLTERKEVVALPETRRAPPPTPSEAPTSTAPDTPGFRF